MIWNHTSSTGHEATIV